MVIDGVLMNDLSDWVAALMPVIGPVFFLTPLVLLAYQYRASPHASIRLWGFWLLSANSAILMTSMIAQAFIREQPVVAVAQIAMVALVIFALVAILLLPQQLARPPLGAETDDNRQAGQAGPQRPAQHV